MNARPITAWLEEWSALWRTENLGRRLTVEPDRRIRRSLGRCRPASGRITLHPALFEPENVQVLREVVCHEAAHAAVHLLHGTGVRPHGREWKALVAGAGYPPRARMDLDRLPGQLRSRLGATVRYRHRCATCGATRTAGRRVRNWRCSKCRGRGSRGLLEIVCMKLKALAVIALLTSTVLSCSATDAVPQVRFTDDFEGDLAGWRLIGEHAIRTVDSGDAKHGRVLELQPDGQESRYRVAAG